MDRNTISTRVTDNYNSELIIEIDLETDGEIEIHIEKKHEDYDIETIELYQDNWHTPYTANVAIGYRHQHFVMLGHARKYGKIYIYGFMAESYQNNSPQPDSIIPYDNIKNRYWISKDNNHKVGTEFVTINNTLIRKP